MYELEDDRDSIGGRGRRGRVEVDPITRRDPSIGHSEPAPAYVGDGSGIGPVVHFEGSDHGFGAGGRLYCTAMAAMILEVYYRHMPLYTDLSTKDKFRN